MKLDGKTVVWPANIDSSKTRLQGRKIPKGAAVQAPRIDEMSEAARQLSIEVEMAQQKSRPKTWWEKTGYIIIPKKRSKSETLRSISTEIRRIRAPKSDEKPRKPP